jgi:antitoxin CptB
MAPSKDAGEDIAIRRRRLRYRAWHRGTREMDLVLGPFADAHAPTLGAGDLDRLEGLMDEEDTDLLRWVMGQDAPPAHIDLELLGRLIAFRTSAIIP